MNRTLAWIAKAAGGRRYGNDCVFGQVGTDTRDLQPGDLFVALDGENCDGHEFVARAAELGAAGALVSRRNPAPLPQVVVPDTHGALANMAHVWRKAFDVPAVAVTGSSGKTTVKELVAAILSVDRPVCATRGNFNNEIGVPLTLMRLAPDDAALVAELGANHAGEIAKLAALVEPKVGVLTNAGAAHLEGFGSLAAVAAAKGELLDALPKNGTAILNADDPFFGDWRARSRADKVLTFGLVTPADFSIVGKPVFDDEGSNFVLRMRDGNRLDIRLPLLGMHSVLNALTAAAAARALGASPDSIVAGLATARAVGGRLKRMRGRGGAIIIDDAYNANPASVQAALDYLAERGGRRIFVFGDMAELGPQAPELHREVGAYAKARCDELLTIGPLAKNAASAYGPGAQNFDAVDAAAAALIPQLDADLTVLIKASRVMGLDRLARLLAAPDEGPEAAGC